MRESLTMIMTTMYVNKKKLQETSASYKERFIYKYTMDEDPAFKDILY